MTKQNNALRLADWLDDQYDPDHHKADAAAELRRLHAENVALQQSSTFDGVIPAAIRSYLRKCSSGGMPKKHIDIVQVNVDEAERLGYFKLAIAEAVIASRVAAPAPQLAPAPSAVADLIAALEEARSAINSMKVEAETAGQGDEQMMLEACETISNEGLQADMAIRAALASAPKPSSTPQADSQPAPAYKDSTPELHVGDSAFESWYSTYNPAHKGDKQRARDAYAAGMGEPLVMAAPAAVAGPSEFPHEQMDAVALARYKVVPSHESMLHRHAVVAGDGSQQLYIGREVECENMARKFAGAFLDGAFAFHSMLAAAPVQQAQEVPNG